VRSTGICWTGCCRRWIAAELGEWARGYALDQRLSGDKARRELGWAPRHLDPEGEILFGGPPRGPDTK